MVENLLEGHFNGLQSYARVKEDKQLYRESYIIWMGKTSKISAKSNVLTSHCEN